MRRNADEAKTWYSLELHVRSTLTFAANHGTRSWNGQAITTDKMIYEKIPRHYL
ncbi:MAG: hypothetical protein ACLPXB_13525 [Thiobacillaceae bacterium]